MYETLSLTNLLFLKDTECEISFIFVKIVKYFQLKKKKKNENVAKNIAKWLSEINNIKLGRYKHKIKHKILQIHVD